MKEPIRKYVRAVKGSCSNDSGHYFHFVYGVEAEEIRKEHPRWKYALWKCVHCGGITEST